MGKNTFYEFSLDAFRMASLNSSTFEGLNRNINKLIQLTGCITLFLLKEILC